MALSFKQKLSWLIIASMFHLADKEYEVIGKSTWFVDASVSSH